MNRHWRRYWDELEYYLRYAPLGLLIGLVFFALNQETWRKTGGLWPGLALSLIFGAVIPLTICVFFGVFYGGLTWIAVKTGRFYPPPFVLNIVLGSLGGVTGFWLVLFGRSLLLGEPIEGPPFLSTLITTGAVVLVLSLYFAYRKAREESLKLQVEAAKSKYAALENQMRPHFLFNALNSLAELIESKSENAAETVYKLSDLYRRILAHSGMQMARLSAEIEIAKAYLELEQLRFGSRLSFEIVAPERSDEIFLPSLMIQTLVENAVKHGLAPAIEGGRISIEVSQPAGQLYRLAILNTGAPWRGENGNGTGLANTRARLDLLYGDRHHFKVETDQAGRTAASFFFTGEKID